MINPPPPSKNGCYNIFIYLFKYFSEQSKTLKLNKFEELSELFRLCLRRLVERITKKRLHFGCKPHAPQIGYKAEPQICVAYMVSAKCVFLNYDLE